MPERIVIIDDATTQRIVISAALRVCGFEACCYGCTAEAKAALARNPAGVILTTLSTLQSKTFKSLSQPAGRAWICAIVPEDTPQLRLDALRAGADIVMASPVKTTLLGAGLRRLQGLRRDQEELLPEWDNARALGFAESGTKMPLGGRILVDGPDRALPAAIGRFSHAQTSMIGSTVSTGDVVILDRRNDPGSEAQLLRKMTDLRAQSATRQMMQMVLFDPKDATRAALALDMGADDVLVGTYGAAEIAHRANRLIRRKQSSETFRSRVRDGLRAAVTDPLTGLANRRFALPKLVQLSQDRQPLAVCAIDLDHFKKVNDSYGHPVGDEVLAAIAARLRNAAAPGDLVARTGGEEFLVAAHVTGIPEAKSLAARLCKLIRATPVTTRADRLAIPITASIGVSFCTHALVCDQDAEAMMAAADEALYSAKHAGRNRVTMAKTAA